MSIPKSDHDELIGMFKAKKLVELPPNHLYYSSDPVMPDEPSTGDGFTLHLNYTIGWGDLGQRHPRDYRCGFRDSILYVSLISSEA